MAERPTGLLGDMLTKIETEDSGTVVIHKEDQSISQEQFDVFRDMAIATAVERRLLITIGYDPTVKATIAIWRLAPEPAPGEEISGGS